MVVSQKACGTPARIGDAERGHARPGLHQQRIHVPVIAALEFDDQVASGESARQRGWRDMVASVPEFTSRTISMEGHGVANGLGQFDLALGGRAEAGADARARLRAPSRISGWRCPSSSGPQEPT